ncbi:hypothetical protein KHM19_25640 [Leptospira borgpetersenii]|nr:hypothetical protein KHM09_06430 [Leptospira borgpetersenii]GIM23381.1 hypothetical protein KHM19_25640 [Leptospira borgpetersenii]GIM26681.1 hypothetical protein KHM25_26060 [Leptospira borgpetersenii]
MNVFVDENILQNLSLVLSWEFWFCILFFARQTVKESKFDLEKKIAEEVEKIKKISGSEELFRAYQALAKLGHKKEALIHLNELKEKYFKEMGENTQIEFLSNLKEAEQW